MLYYGGSAGSGKSDLLLGLASTEHLRSVVYRREATQTVALVDRFAEMLGTREGYNGKGIWRGIDGGRRQLEFGSCPHPGDETRYQGRPHDFVGFDELPNFLESQFRFLCGWARTTTPGQRVRIVGAGNPPTTSEGQWVIRYWGPWLDKTHPDYPETPGKLRWYLMIDGEEREVGGPDPVRIRDEILIPQSRTFIPGRIDDNPFLSETGYKTMLQALPEPLRSQMLKGDFSAGIGDDPWQIIPSEWVDAAMARWAPKSPRGTMDSMGVDVAHGGQDETIISRRHGLWFDELLCFPGAETPNGPATAALVIANRRDAAPVHIDIVGWGASAGEFLDGNGVQTVAINGAHGTEEKDRSGKLGFVNLRALLWWRMREALDPTADTGIALPRDGKLRADLIAPNWSLTPRGVLVWSKDEIKKRIGRSPDRGDAVCMALRATSRRVDRDQKLRTRTAKTAGYA